MLEHIWKLQHQDVEIPTDFAQNLHPAIRNILVSRGIVSNEQLETFSHPNFNQLHDPFLMKDMHKAVNRLVEAIENHQKLLVYGDYDVDGTTSIALVYSFLQDLRCDVDFYVPDRYLEGYGISKQGIEKAIESHVQLIIALDCGIKANDTIAFAQEHGIDVIVCDHHNEGDELPNAYAVLDPKRHDCEYPFKELSGCGVGYKLLYAYCLQQKIDIRTRLNCYLDYVAISIASDIVPMVDENRVLMFLGLWKMSHKNNQLQKDKVLTSVQTMLDRSNIGFRSNLTVSDIVFKIAPKINAAGRINSARDAVNLLISKDVQQANEWCDAVKKHNDARCALDQSIAQEALQEITDSEYLQKSKSTVLYGAGWHKGVVGIVASRLIESYYRPTIILCGDGDVISGSARSVSDFDLYAAIEKCSQYLESYGGHTFAAGLSMKRENFESFREAFEKIVSESILPYQQQPIIDIDYEIQAEDVTFDFLNQLKLLSPFGPKNMNPVFLVRNLKNNGTRLTKDEVHVQFRFVNERGYVLPNIIGFKMTEHWKQIEQNERFDVCFTISEDEYNGQLRLNLEAKDVRVAK